MTDQPLEIAPCSLRSSYPKRRSAEKAASAMHRRHGKPVEVYQCDLCGAWHVARRPAALRPGRSRF